MEISFRRDVRHQYMVISPEEDFQCGYRAKMILNNRMEGFAECFSEQLNARELFYYDIPAGFVSLAVYMEDGQVTEKLYRMLFAALSAAMIRLQEYLLTADELLLDPAYLFLKPESGKILLVYYPQTQKSFSEKILTFSEDLLHKIRHEERGAVELGYLFYRRCAEESVTAEMLGDMARLEIPPQGFRRERPQMLPPMGAGYANGSGGIAAGGASGMTGGAGYGGAGYAGSGAGYAGGGAGYGSGAGCGDGTGYSGGAGYASGGAGYGSGAGCSDGAGYGSGTGGANYAGGYYGSGTADGGAAGLGPPPGSIEGSGAGGMSQNGGGISYDFLFDGTAGGRQESGRKKGLFGKKEKKAKKEKKDRKEKRTRGTKEKRRRGKKGRETPEPWPGANSFIEYREAGSPVNTWREEGYPENPYPGGEYNSAAYGPAAYETSGYGAGLRANSYEAPGYGTGVGANSYETPGCSAGTGANSYETPRQGAGMGANSYEAPGYSAGTGLNSYETPRQGAGMGVNSYETPVYGSGNGISNPENGSEISNPAYGSGGGSDYSNGSGEFPGKADNVSQNTGTLPGENSLETVLLRKERMSPRVRASLIPKETNSENSISLSKDNYIVGKSVAGADIVLQSAAVSRAHARLSWVDETYGITDLGSRNGTWVNEIPIRPGDIVRMQEGDEIRFADLNYTFHRS